MPRQHYSDLIALAMVARERSFTRAAVELGMSQSMLSHTIRQLEERLGVRLLTRTTRSVSVTEAGERLLAIAAPRLKEIETELRYLTELRDVPVGTVRITAPDHAIDTVVWPKLARILPAYPQINVELDVDYASNDIGQGRYDFGVRRGNAVVTGISAVRISPDQRFAIVATPSYLAAHAAPTRPEDLLRHECISLRLPSRGSVQAWELNRGQRTMLARVNGRLVFNGIYQVLNAALSGQGLAYVPEDLAAAHLKSGKLLPVMRPWWGKFPGYYLLYANQSEPSRAMRVVIDGLRHKD